MRKSDLIRLLLCALIFALAMPCFAAEVAVLKNGFSIRHERREIVGDLTRLYVSADGASFVDVPTADIEHYEPSLDVPAGADAKNGSPSSKAVKSVSGAGNPDLNQVVHSASARYRLDPDLVNSVIKAESGFNARAVSPKGAQGLMQLMPSTASQLGVPNAFDAQANVEGGTRYLRELLERYDFDLVKALAAYNAGPQRVEQFGGVPPYYETRAYVARIVRDFNKKKVAQKNTSGNTLVTRAKSSAQKNSRPKSTSSTTAPRVAPVVQARATPASTTE